MLRLAACLPSCRLLAEQGVCADPFSVTEAISAPLRAKVLGDCAPR
jgi:hypothetical protein